MDKTHSAKNGSIRIMDEGIEINIGNNVTALSYEDITETRLIDPKLLSSGRLGIADKDKKVYILKISYVDGDLYAKIKERIDSLSKINAYKEGTHRSKTIERLNPIKKTIGYVFLFLGMFTLALELIFIILSMLSMSVIGIAAGYIFFALMIPGSALILFLGATLIAPKIEGACPMCGNIFRVTRANKGFNCDACQARNILRDGYVEVLNNG